jgi:hypothetical protein
MMTTTMALDLLDMINDNIDVPSLQYNHAFFFLYFVATAISLSHRPVDSQLDTSQTSTSKSYIAKRTRSQLKQQVNFK